VPNRCYGYRQVRRDNWRIGPHTGNTEGARDRLPGVDGEVAAPAPPPWRIWERKTGSSTGMKRTTPTTRLDLGLSFS